VPSSTGKEANNNGVLKGLLLRLLVEDVVKADDVVAALFIQSYTTDHSIVLDPSPASAAAVILLLLYRVYVICC